VDEQNGKQPVGPREPGPSEAGWHADPYQRHELRYWDGTQWTGHVADGAAVGLEWAEVPASADAGTLSEAAIPANAALAAVGGPGFGSRPNGLPNWATTRSGLHALPGRPPPSPHFSGPMEPDPWGDKVAQEKKHWYSPLWLWILVVVGALVVAAAFVVPALDDGGEPVRRRDPARTGPVPDGYRTVGTNTYRIALPSTWDVEQIDAAVMERAAGGEPAENAGLLTIATDPLTSDTVNVVRYFGVNGNPSGSPQLDAFEADFRAGVAGAEVVGLQTAGIEVLGRPAGRLVASIGGESGVQRTISTAIQTADGIYQVTVTSTSPERAALLNDLVLPTFATR
jgi:hypothetical protein